MMIYTSPWTDVPDGVYNLTCQVFGSTPVRVTRNQHNEQYVVFITRSRDPVKLENLLTSDVLTPSRYGTS